MTNHVHVLLTPRTASGCALLMNSKFGKVLTAIRDSEYRVLALGYNTATYKTFVFALAGGLVAYAAAVLLFLGLSLILVFAFEKMGVSHEGMGRWVASSIGRSKVLPAPPNE